MLQTTIWIQNLDPTEKHASTEGILAKKTPAPNWNNIGQIL